MLPEIKGQIPADGTQQLVLSLSRDQRAHHHIFARTRPLTWVDGEGIVVNKPTDEEIGMQGKILQATAEKTGENWGQILARVGAKGSDVSRFAYDHAAYGDIVELGFSWADHLTPQELYNKFLTLENGFMRMCVTARRHMEQELIKAGKPVPESLTDEYFWNVKAS